MSVGGVVDFSRRLSALAKKNGVKVYIPSGAIAGIDALKAARHGKIKKVILSTYKNPRSFKGVRYVDEKKIKLDKIKKDTVLFSGSAKEAVKLFPQNINVAAVLSIAGIGRDKTRVRIVASPSITKNIHQIEIESQAGKILTRTENTLHPDNPKTSYLAYLSAVATLKQLFEPVKVGT
jgi:aspartate dehydrogenase